MRLLDLTVRYMVAVFVDDCGIVVGVWMYVRRLVCCVQLPSSELCTVDMPAGYFGSTSALQSAADTQGTGSLVFERPEDTATSDGLCGAGGLFLTLPALIASAYDPNSCNDLAVVLPGYDNSSLTTIGALLLALHVPSPHLVVYMSSGLCICAPTCPHSRSPFSSISLVGQVEHVPTLLTTNSVLVYSVLPAVPLIYATRCRALTQPSTASVNHSSHARWSDAIVWTSSKRSWRSMAC